MDETERSTVHRDGGPELAARPPRLGPVAASVVSLLLFGSLVVLPGVGLVVAPLASIPVLQHAAAGRSSAAVWGPAAGLLAVVTVLTREPTAAFAVISFLLVVALPTTAVGWWRRRGWTEGRWAALSTLAGLVLCLVVGLLLAAPADPVSATASMIDAALEQTGDLYQGMGLSRGETALYLDVAQRTFSWLVPSLAVAYLVAVLFWVRSRLGILGFSVPAGQFEQYRSEEWLPAAFVVTGAGTLLLAGTARWVAVNGLACVLILYFVHGLAIIRAHLARLVGRGWLVRWGVALVCLQVPLPLLVVALGLGDSFFQLRPRPPEDDRRQT